MGTFYAVIYLVSFCLLVGCGFALMYINLRSIYETLDRPITRHPEAPEPGEEVMYIDVSQDSAADFEARKKQLEDLYND
tara:strand:- start:1356 stop:1592 length:237 start_codon:yes stop_codon:yes gene_type:complete